jgi:hypothetical protein
MIFINLFTFHGVKEKPHFRGCILGFLISEKNRHSLVTVTGYADFLFTTMTLTAAYKIQGKAVEMLQNDLIEAMMRAKNVLPAFCGLYGSCGAAVELGIYRTLKTLEDRELVTYEWVTDEAGPAKKNYMITDKGLECLENWVNTLQMYSKKIDKIIEDAKDVLKKY